VTSSCGRMAKTKDGAVAATLHDGRGRARSTAPNGTRTDSEVRGDTARSDDDDHGPRAITNHPTSWSCRKLTTSPSQVPWLYRSMSQHVRWSEGQAQDGPGTTNPAYAAVAHTLTRGAALYFSRPVRLFRPSKSKHSY
jgi:hypothetical protein